MKKLLIFACVLVCLIPAAAIAVEANGLFIAPLREANSANEPDYAIKWYQSKNEYYLFLPASLDLSTAQIDMKGISSLSIIGYGDVHPGDSAGFLQPGDYKIKLNKKNSILHVMRGSDGLATLYITTESGSLDYIEANKEHQETGTLCFVNADGNIEYNGPLEHIKTRGNSSMTFAKKNYQIKLEKSTDLMGFGKAKKWILTSNYRDKSFIRNQIVLDMANYAGLPYTPEHAFAEVYINHEYRGLYLFSEKVEIDGDRIGIADLEKETEKLNGGDMSIYPILGSKKAVKGHYKAYDIPNIPEDITGGYLIEYERYETRYRQETSVYMTKKGNVLVIKSPEYASQQQMDYISSRLQAFESAIFAKDGYDADTGLHYSEIMDLSSLIAKYMIEEICKNYDGNTSSQFFFKPSDAISEKIYAGPAWDYDSSFGSYAQPRNAKNVLSGKGLWIANNDHGPWYPQLYRLADFRSGVIEFWNLRLKGAVEILLGISEPDSTLRSIDEYADSIRESAAMDLKKWPRLAKPSTVAQTGHTFQMNIDYLKVFLTDRYEYLCGEWSE